MEVTADNKVVDSVSIRDTRAATKYGFSHPILIPCFTAKATLRIRPGRRTRNI